jgi:hypothetical protein
MLGDWKPNGRNRSPRKQICIVTVCYDSTLDPMDHLMIIAFTPCSSDIVSGNILSSQNKANERPRNICAGLGGGDVGRF